MLCDSWLITYTLEYTDAFICLLKALTLRNVCFDKIHDCKHKTFITKRFLLHLVDFEKHQNRPRSLLLKHLLEKRGFKVKKIER